MGKVRDGFGDMDRLKGVVRCKRSVKSVITEINYRCVMDPVHGLPSTRHQRLPFLYIDSYTTQTVTCYSILQFPSSIALITLTQLNALITQLSPITHSPESYYTHYMQYLKEVSTLLTFL